MASMTGKADRPLVGIVVVSHSGRLAEGVVEVARQMAGDDVTIEAVGGAPDGSIGTDPDAIAAAIRRADSGAGVVVIGDPGSAIMASEVAIELLGDEVRGQIRISRGPLVEGAVFAAPQAGAGRPLADVLAAAESARDLDKGVTSTPSAADDGPPEGDAASARPAGSSPPRPDAVRLVVRNASGLHARPAATFVRTAGRFEAEITVRNLTRGGDPVDAKSSLGILTLGAGHGTEIEVAADGPDAAEALAAIRDAVERGLGEAPGSDG
jgi:dihydroxyacetone kinase phosphotransfer subunit